MSRTSTKTISDIEEGEIHTDDEVYNRDEVSYPSAEKEPNSNLEDLSSCEELFSSDSITPKVYGKEKRYSKVRRRVISSSTNLKETEKVEDGKRKCLRKRLPLRTTGKPDPKQDEAQSRRRHQPRRECSVSFSSKTEKHRDNVRISSRHGTRRIHSEVSIKVVHQPKNASDSHANKLKQKKNIEPPDKILYSCPEKAVPKTSLKKRLMNMITFSSGTNDLEEEPLTVPERCKDNEMVATISLTKELEKSEPVKKETEIKRKRKVSSVHGDLGKESNPKKIKTPASDLVNVDQTEKVEQVAELAPSKAQEIVTTEQKDANISAVDTNDSGLAADDDLVVLRKLALESSALAASNRRTTLQVPVVAREEQDDLTELRLKALHSAVLKKHVARKAKAAAIASAKADCSAVPISHPFSSHPSQSGQEKQPQKALSSNAFVNQWGESYDKTTAIVDMDLGNTTDEDSPPPSDSLIHGDNRMHLCEASMSPYYVPELWTPINEDELIESNTVDSTVHGNSYHANGSYEVSRTHEIQPFHIPFAPSIGKAQQLPDLQAFVNPPQIYHKQLSPKCDIISPKTLNKYSIRPNLINLPIAQMLNDQRAVHPPNLDSNLSLASTDSTFSSHCKSQSNPQVSSTLIQIELNNPAAKNEMIDKKVIEKAVDAEGTKKKEGSPSEVSVSKQKPRNSDCADMSDTENMDITSMIVVDEIVCTSPEPDFGKASVPSSPVPQPASNVLRDVPVPSSRYASRSVVQNNTTPRMVQSIKPPNTIQKQGMSLVNPFILNNLKKDVLLTRAASNASLAKHRVSQSTSASSLIRVPNQSPLETTKPKQMSFNSKSQAKIVPTTNPESSGRFVIHLGEDSDSDDDGQTLNHEYYPLPARTIINEIALQQKVSLNPQSLFLPQNDPNLIAHVDAFLKDARAKHDRKAALMKQKEALPSTTCTSVVDASAPNRLTSATRSGKLAVKAEKESEIPMTANAYPPSNRTVIMPLKAPKQMETKISANTSTSSCTVTMTSIVENQKKVVTFTHANSSISRTISLDTGKQMDLASAVNERPSNRRTVNNADAMSSFISGTVKTPDTAVRKTEAKKFVSNTSSAGYGKIYKMKAAHDNISNSKAGVPLASSPLVCGMAVDDKKQVPSKNAHALKSVQTSQPSVASLAASTDPKPNKLAVKVPLLSPIYVESNATVLKNTLKTSKPPIALSTNSNSLKSNKLVTNVPILSPMNVDDNAMELKLAFKTVQAVKLPITSSTIGSASKQNKLAAMLPIPSAIQAKSKVVEHKNLTCKNIKNAAQITFDTTQTANRNLRPKINAMTLELTESKLLKERAALLLDLSTMLDHINDSSKVEHAINEMQETISQQEKIIDLAQRSIKLTNERIACEAKKKAHTFNLINNKRKTVAYKRDLCCKLRDECVSLGSKLKGESYIAPQTLEAELLVRLGDVSAGIKTMKDVTPQKKGESYVPIPCDRPSFDVRSDVVRSLAYDILDAPASGSFQRLSRCDQSSSAKLPVLQTDSGHFDIISSKSNEDDYRPILLMDCPYEINGICGDVTDCPFIHKKHR